MTSWINNPILTGQTIILVPLQKEHLAELEIIAKEKKIWEFYPFDCSTPEGFKKIHDALFIEKEKGTQFPFIIFHQPTSKIIGSTRFIDIQFAHKKLEIGGTWLQPAYWATAINLECKLLLLTHCFEVLQTTRVQLKTDKDNIRSRKAIEKIGAQFEGILRHDMVRDNNTHRDSAYYSIIDEEWNEKKLRLTELFERKLTAEA